MTNSKGLTQYESLVIDGLQVVIDHQTGAVYASQKALARLINKSDSSVRFHEESLLQTAQEIDKIEAQIQTSQGLRTAQLYGEKFIYSLLAKYKPDLLVQAAYAGLRVYFYGVAGYSPEVISEQATKALPGWTDAREITKFTHMDFLNACKAKRHPSGKVHDLITKLVTGYTAKEAINGLPLVDDELDPDVGLNHQPDADQLLVIAKAKKLYSKYTKGNWQDQCRRAVSQANPD